MSLWEPNLDEAAGSYSAEEVVRIPGHPEEVYAIEFIKGRPNHLLTGSGECLFLWDSGAGSLLHMVQAESGAFVDGREWLAWPLGMMMLGYDAAMCGAPLICCWSYRWSSMC